MPLGTTPLHSPGCNEGKARNETLGKHGQKNKNSVGVAQLRAFGLCRCGLWLYIRWESAAPTELKNVWEQLTQGLRPGL